MEASSEVGGGPQSSRQAASRFLLPPSLVWGHRDTRSLVTPPLLNLILLQGDSEGQVSLACFTP